MRTSSATLIAGATVSAVAAALWMNKHRPWSREEKGRTAPQLDNRYVGAASGRPAGSPVPSYHAPESGFGRMEEEQDRGRRPHIDRSGEVHGSGAGAGGGNPGRSEEHTSELQSLMRISYAVFCLKKKK